MADFLVIFRIASGSTFARGPDKEDAIERCRKMAASDWSSLFDVSEKPVKLAVYDVEGVDELWWDHRVFAEGSEEPIPVLEVVDVVLPKVRKRR